MYCSGSGLTHVPVTLASGAGDFSPSLNTNQCFLSPKKQKLVHIFQGPLMQQLLLPSSFHG